MAREKSIKSIKKPRPPNKKGLPRDGEGLFVRTGQK